MGGDEPHLIYEFDGFRLDPARRQLLSPGGVGVEISPRGFDTLQFLVEHPGELVDKATLMQAVWPDTVVEENNLNQAISAVRRALEDRPGDHRFILTEAGRGYRFVAEVREVGTETPKESNADAREPTSIKSKSRTRPTLFALAAAAVIAALSIVVFRADRDTPETPAQNEPEKAVVVSRPSVAVLPFADMSPEGDQEYFADGIAEELLNQLARMRGLHVAGRTSSFSFRNKDEDLRVIGERLNVANILEGSVRKAGNAVRITVQLVKAADGYQLWSKTFDRKLDDIFAIQEEIAGAVADSLSLTLGVDRIDLGASGTDSFEAYDAFLEARSLMLRQGSDNYTRAIELLENAVEVDPDYAEAWSLLAIVYRGAGTTFIAGNTEELLEKGDRAASRAVELAPEAVSSLQILADRDMVHGNWVEAELKLKKALALAPTDIVSNIRYGLFKLSLGRPSEAIEYFRQAVNIDPLALAPAQQLGMALQMHGDTDAALQQLEHAKSLIGNYALLNGVILVLALEIDDRTLIEDLLDSIENDPTLPPAARGFTREILTKLDSPQDALEFLRRSYLDPAFGDPVSQNVISLYASYFGDHEFSLRINRELAQRGLLAEEQLWRDIYSGVRRLPGFKDLVRDIGLVDYWRRTGNWSEFCQPLGPDDFECR